MRAEVLGPDRIRLEWQAPTVAWAPFEGSLPSHYAIMYKRVAADVWARDNVSGTTSAVVTGLIADSLYEFQVLALVSTLLS